MNTVGKSKEHPGITASPQWTSWLKEHKISLMFSSYRLGKLFLTGLDQEEQVSVFERDCIRVMGLCSVNSQRVYMSTLYQIWHLENMVQEDDPNKTVDCLFWPAAAYTTGNIAIHDMAVDSDGNLLFINSLFNCLCTLSKGFSFRPLWKPKFISELKAEDRCHLNGLAMKDGKAKYTTAVGITDTVDGWREHRTNGGILIDLESDEIICQDLSMPHSPRWYRDKLWLLNSGTGDFGFMDLEKGRFEQVAFCPGYLRGLCFVGDFAVVGLSESRHDPDFKGLPLFDRMKKHQTQAFCGLQVIDLRSGKIVHSLDCLGKIKEIYDVISLPGIQIPGKILNSLKELRETFLIDDSEKIM
ncbi:MAG: hypothetical protein ACI9S8_001160 [Chlamydiales bacterium]|jgi:uncharacterized protein (TIGR03032 family)